MLNFGLPLKMTDSNSFNKLHMRQFGISAKLLNFGHLKISPTGRSYFSILQTLNIRIPSLAFLYVSCRKKVDFCMVGFY